MKLVAVCVGVAAATISVATNAGDQAELRIDCSSAVTAAEQTICADEYATFLSLGIRRQIAALRSVRREHAADHERWLHERDLCGNDLACLSIELEKRWNLLGRRIEMIRGVTAISGVYEYVARPEEISGDLVIAAGPDGNYGFSLVTVQLQQAHICEIWSGAAHLTEEGVVTWLDPGTGHKLQMRPAGDGRLILNLPDPLERSFCGARAHLRGLYRLK